jgi:glutamate synthase domain-containing protein 3
MTGGVVVVLGPVGSNLGAGMSNGVAYVLDVEGIVASRCNTDMVELSTLDEGDERQLLALIHEHAARTASPRAQRILTGWPRFRAMFRKVAPRAPAAVPETPPVKRAQRTVTRTVEVRP